MDCRNKFWLENIGYIFCDHRIIPSQHMTFERQLNTLTRLVIIVGLLLYLLGYKQSILFILISILMIILGYYIKNSNMSIQENYNNQKFGGSQFYSGRNTNIQTSSDFVSLNQSLVGPPNPKTLVKPIIINPAYDITRQASELNVPTGINKRSVQFLGDSGYYVRDTATRSVSVFPNVVENNKESVEYYVNPVANTPRQSGMTSRTSTMPNDSYDYRTFGEPAVNVNTACVYNPTHYNKFGAPNNVPISKCDMEDRDFNERIYTQYVQPNSYTKTQVVGFPSSNIGISFQEPLYNTTVTKNQQGGNTFTELDPNQVFEPEPFNDPYQDEPTYSEVYDPRLNGYGSQKRAYIDPMTGQPRYFYKDVDAVRRGNLFTRNNIDHLPFAQQTGLMKDYVNLDTHCQADSAYLDQNSQFRENLQQSLMGKRNQEMWQLRKYPMSRAGNRVKNLR